MRIEAEKKVIQQVIHVIAPPDESRVSILADLSVKEISHPLQRDHYRHSPKPPEVAGGEVTEYEDRAPTIRA